MEEHNGSGTTPDELADGQCNSWQMGIRLVEPEPGEKQYGMLNKEIWGRWAHSNDDHHSEQAKQAQHVQKVNLMPVYIPDGYQADLQQEAGGSLGGITHMAENMSTHV